MAKTLLALAAVLGWNHHHHHNGAASAFVIENAFRTRIATSVARYRPTQRLLFAGINYHDSSLSAGAAGNPASTDCLVVVADANGAFHPIFLGSEICGATAVLNRGASGGGGGTSVGMNEMAASGGVFEGGLGVVVGVTGNRSSLSIIENIDGEVPTKGPTYGLVDDRFPVALATDSTDRVYVALHHTGGAVPDVTTINNNQAQAENLGGLREYLDNLTNPETLRDRVATGSTSDGFGFPELQRVDPRTGVIDYTAAYALPSGVATVSALAFLPSQGTAGNDALVMAGSTTGSGSVFGGEDDETPGDWDGFLAFLDPVTGRLDDGHPSGVPVIRVDSAEGGRSDFVRDACYHEPTNSLYVVGTTEGSLAPANSGERAAFVLRIDLDSREVIARRQLAGGGRNDDGRKVACLPDTIFVGGHENPSAVSATEKTTLFVAAYDATLTQERWRVGLDSSSYVGESRENELVSMDENPLGNLNVLLNTMNPATGVSQVLLLDLDLADGGNDFARGATTDNGGGITGGKGVIVDVASDFEGEDVALAGDEPPAEIALVVLLPILGVALVVGLASFYSDRNRRRNANHIPVTIVRHKEEEEDHGGTTEDAGDDNGVELL